VDQFTPTESTARAGDLVPSIAVIEAAPIEGGTPTTLPYRQISILRPPRTLWERIRARFGARFFEVVTESRRPDR
jgi:hypothetical protein